MFGADGNCALGMKQLEADEHVHQQGPEPTFNESVYISCFDHALRLSDWLHARVSEGVTWQSPTSAGLNPTDGN